MPRTESVVIPFEGDASRFVASTKQVSSGLDSVVQKAKGLGSGIFTDLSSAFGIADRAIRMVGQAYTATIGEMVKYGDQVKQLSTITGQSAEQTSRTIQLADDLRVSYESLSVALRTASKQGIDTSIDGLIKLGEQYKKLQSGTERTEFLMEKFGRQGVEMGKILEKTSDQIRELAENTPDGLILGDEDIKNIEEYNRVVDELGDTFTELKITVGKKVLPELNNFLFFYMHLSEAVAERNRLMAEGFEGNASLQALENLKEKYYGVADAAETAGETGVESLEDIARQADDTAKRMSSLYRDISKGAFEITKSNRDYAESLEDLANEEADIAQRRKDIEYDLYQFRAEMSAKIAEADSAKEKQRLLEEQAKKEEDYYRQLQQNEQDLAGLDEKRLDVDRKKIEADNQKKYNLLEQRALIDGIISSGENEWLLEQAVNLGLITPAARDAAIAQSQWADAMYASFAKTQPGMETTLDLMQRMAAFDGTVVNFGVNFHSNAGSFGTAGYSASRTSVNFQSNAGSFGTAGYSASRTTPSGTSSSAARAEEFMLNLLNSNPGWQDSGGSGMAGEPYMIGTGAQPEMFIPKTNGTFIPNADKKFGATYNIVINNPKRETSENSIRNALKRLSYTGVVQ